MPCLYGLMPKLPSLPAIGGGCDMYVIRDCFTHGYERLALVSSRHSTFGGVQNRVLREDFRGRVILAFAKRNTTVWRLRLRVLNLLFAGSDRDAGIGHLAYGGRKARQRLGREASFAEQITGVGREVLMTVQASRGPSNDDLVRVGRGAEAEVEP